MKTYSELITLPTFEQRFNYLSCGSLIGDTTFGGHRIVNQQFYNSLTWRNFRNSIIVRDNGNDMALNGFEVPDKHEIIIHHINPITLEDLLEERPCVMDPENVVCVAFLTHNAIHFGNMTSIGKIPGLSEDRRPNDMCPWK